MKELTAEGGSAEYQAANQWIHQKMDYYYLWREHLPELPADLNVYPVDYFQSLLYRSDKFSSIKDLSPGTRTLSFDEDDETYVNDYGIRYFTIDLNNPSRFFLLIAEVRPGSPAEKAGIERGQFFPRFNGKAFNSDNYRQALAGQTVTLTRCDLNGRSLGDITLTSSTFLNTPILYENIYEIDGVKVGYLYYTNFVSGGSNKRFETELKEVFGRFKAAGVSELILDLRYNPGGLLSVAILLSSLIAPEYAVANNDIFAYSTYNGVWETTVAHPFSLSPADIANYNLNLSRLCVLGTLNSASASEVTLWCLRQHMEVLLFGSATLGKNVGSISVSKAGINYELHPIVARITDCRHEEDPSYVNGIPADRIVNEVKNNRYQIGKIGEVRQTEDYDNLLYSAINYLRVYPQGESTQRESDDETRLPEAGDYILTMPSTDHGTILDVIRE